MIDWKTTQQALANAGQSPGPIDGQFGRATMGALMGLAARRQPDAMIRSLAAALVTDLPRHGITNNELRLSEFLAQTSHETGGFSRFEESMHYSAKRMMQIWPRRFPTLQSALPYAWDPSDPDREDIALANLVYGGRMGNQTNGTDDDDGWETRGGGMLQHTGLGEYTLLRERLGATPEQVHTDPVVMARAACDYWTRRGVNPLCDRRDFASARRAVNGGEIGLAEIAHTRTRLMAVIQ